MRLYVGNISFNASQESLHEAFSAFGQVSSISVVTDRDTGRPRGFGFVEMSTDREGRAAIDGLNGTDLEGRALNVNEARPRPERGGFGGGNDRGRGRQSRW